MTDSPASAMTSETRVVYVIDVADRPGIAHAIAAVFAHRGLSMRALIADTQRQPPRIMVVFNGTVRQARLVEQVLARLHDIQAVRMVPADSDQLRAVALCRGPTALPTFERVIAQNLDGSWLLSGSYADLEAALAELQDRGLVADVSRSLVAL